MYQGIKVFGVSEIIQKKCACSASAHPAERPFDAQPNCLPRSLLRKARQLGTYFPHTQGARLLPRSYFHKEGLLLRVYSRETVPERLFPQGRLLMRAYSRESILEAIPERLFPHGRLLLRVYSQEANPERIFLRVYSREAIPPRLFRRACSRRGSSPLRLAPPILRQSSGLRTRIPRPMMRSFIK